MTILCDTAALDAELVAGAQWQRVAAAALCADDATLWQALDGPVELVTSAGPVEPFATLAIVGFAPQSQMDALERALRAGMALSRPLACVALDGVGFHGQRQRVWATARGNLFLTVALPLDLPAATILPVLPALPAVAVVDAIRGAGGRAGIKWVNDIEIGARKVGGVLVTSRCTGARLDHVLLGVGVNVATAPALAPTPVVSAATALAAEGLDVTLGGILAGVLSALARRWQSLREDGPAPLVAAYADASVLVGEEVAVVDEAADAAGAAPVIARGRVLGIDTDLALRLEGRAEPVRRGRVVRVAPR
jgi:BirA family biotin operon repressor/biotin-[acetyl-CoA-carboxylase] ligase